MSIMPFLSATSSFSSAIPPLLLHQENPFDEQNTLIQKASEPASVALKGLRSSEMTRTAKSSCLYGLTSGIAGSIFFKNPLFLLMGLSECFPKASAQQKVGNEFQVNTYTTDSQAFPSVTSFSNDNFVVTWDSDGQDGSFEGVYGQLFNGNGAKIGSEFRANSYISGYQRSPSVTSLISGNFVVTWESQNQDSSGYGVYGQLFDGNGMTIGSEFPINTYIDNHQLSPSVASFSNVNFIVTWGSDRQDGSSYGVYGQLFDSNRIKIGTEFQVNTYTTSSQHRPSVASLLNGNFVVNWESTDQDGSGEGVYGQLFDGNGIKIGSEFRVNSYTIGDQIKPSAASLLNGNFVVTWQSAGQDGSNWGIFGQFFNETTSKIGNEFQVNTYTNNIQSSPATTSFSNGNFVVTWNSRGQDGSVDGVYGQLFNGNGSNIGNEFQVNTYTNHSQLYPSVASLADGNFVITWQSYNQDGSGMGIYGQIFHDNITYPLSSTTTSSSTTRTTTTSSTTSSVSSSTSVPSTTTTASTTSSVSSSTSVPSTTTTASTTSSVSSSTSVPSTTTTASTTSSISSSSTTSTADRTQTSMNPSSTTLSMSSSSKIPASSTSKQRITSVIPFATSDPSNRLSWVWFLLGGIGAIFCFSLTGYFVFKSRGRKKEDEVPAFELGADHDYSKTPDFVTADPGQGYSKTPDFVTADPGQGYSKTPDFVTADPSHGYSQTPDFVTADPSHGYSQTPDFVTAGEGEGEVG